MPRLRDILRQAAIALAAVAMLMWTFRVHTHLPSASDGHADHSSQACVLLGLLDGDEPEPADDGGHCDCPGAACAPPQPAVAACQAGAVICRLRPESLAIPDGLLHQPDPPPVRSA